MYTITELFDLERTQAKEYLLKFTYPWEALKGLKGYIRALGYSLKQEEYQQVAAEVWVHKTAVVAPTACLLPPCIIGAQTEIRHGAYLRGGVLIGKECVVGNSVEIKNAILFDGGIA